MRKLSIGDYYSCSSCQKWHRVPAIGLGQEHLKFFDSHITNSNAPEYYYCSRCGKWHHNNRQHLKFKILIYYDTGNQNINQHKDKPIPLNHDEILSLIKEYVISKKEFLIGHNIFGTNSLPRPCTRESRLYLPDLILCKDLRINESFKSRYSISHIIEVETQTGEDFVIDKIKRANECIKIMIQQKHTQNASLLPKLIFFYRAPFYLDYIRGKVDKLKLDYLDKVVIEYWNNDNKWYELLHETKTGDSTGIKSKEPETSNKYISSNQNDCDRLFERFWK